MSARRFPSGKAAVSCLALMAIALIAGCATPGTRQRPASPGGIPGADSPAFSDEVSRDLVRQTRELLALKDMDYLVGPDDVLEVSIFEWELSEQTKTLEFRVAESGTIALPALGAVMAAGKTVLQVQQAIEKAILDKGVLQNPRVGVAVKEYRSRRISVIGEVHQPGVYAIHENVSTVMDMLTLAGGPTENAGQRAIVLRKQTEKAPPVRIAVNLEELLDSGSFDQNAVLQGDDVVFVPRAPMVYVYGQVKRPGAFALQRPMRAIEALSMAGGFERNAQRRACYVSRRDRRGDEQVIPLDVAAIERGDAPDLLLRENDVLRVPEDPAKVAASGFWDFFRGIFTFTYRLDSQE